ncbi:MAG: ComEC/Rec2 family competence protein [Proteobacteria bacterium]|nr:ComEC/Rec2 family competence protein [Pseudomonadota bacterium]
MTGVRALAFLGGVLLALFAYTRGLHGGLWLAGAGVPLWCVPRLRALAALCAGVAWAWWPLQQYDRARLPASFDQRVLVSAEIEGLPLLRGAEESFTALLRPLRAGDLPTVRMRATLHWPDAPEVHAGQRWQLLVALHAPAAGANPGSAALALQPLRLRVHATGQVVASALNRPLASSGATLDALRERIARAIAARVTERDAAALIIALAIGDTQRVSSEQWRVFNAVGITHLVAISGLHVTLFCLCLAWAAARLWERIRCLQQRLPRHTFATLIGLAASLGYALLAGWSVPTQRTLLMLATWHGLRWAARPRPAARTLAAGLVGVLLLDPFAPLAAGFWLSFLAVGALLVQGALASVPLRGWRALLGTQMYVMAALLPATLAVFGSVSLAGLAVNLAAIPLFSLLLVPLILLATVMLALWPALATLLFKLAAWLISCGWPSLHAIASGSFALLRLAPPTWWYLLAAAALGVALLPWRPWMRCTALLALLPAALPASGRIEPGGLGATVLDVGRGEAVLLRTARHALLFDDGEVWGSHGAIAANLLVNALRHYHVRALDAVILPRLDGDRGAGVLALSAVLPVRGLAAGGAGALPPEFGACQAGARWSWDDVQFDVLDGKACSLRVRAGDASLLLPGSAAALGAARALEPAPRAIVLPVSRSASAMRPLRQPPADAAWLLLSGGGRDAARPDTAAMMHAWADEGAHAFVTGLDGALELRISPVGRIELECWRQACGAAPPLLVGPAAVP